MAKKKWMKSAVKHPGVFSAAAARAGKTTHEYAEEHKHDSGVIGKRARLALVFEKERPKRKKSMGSALYGKDK